jgi:hypothetical protein
MTGIVEPPLDAFEEKLTVTPLWFEVKALGKVVQIGADLLSMEADKAIAEELGIDVQTAWRIRQRLLETYWPETLDEVRCLFPKIVGEDSNVKLAILALFTLKLADPGERLMGIIVEGSNSVGKSHFSKNILKPLQMEQLGPEPGDTRVIEFTRMTGAFLERALAHKNLDRRILFMQEISNAPYQLHLTLSEGKLKIGIVVREGGEFKPMEIEAQGQPFLWATSVEWHGSPDLIHRSVVLNLDESEEQTWRIVSFESKMAADLHFHDYIDHFADAAARLFYHIWRNTPDNVKVVVPFIEKLQEKIVLEANVKLRRDWNKMIALIRASAILFWKHRYRFKQLVDDGSGLKREQLVIIADERDLENVLPLLSTSFRQTLTNLSNREKKVIDLLLEKYANNGEGEPTPAYVKDIARETGIPAQSLRNYIIPSLEAKGYIVCDRDGRAMGIYLVRRPRDLLINDSIMQEIKASVKSYILRVTFGGDSQDISSVGNLGICKLNPEWASFFQNLLKHSPISRMGENKGKNDGENREKGFSPPETAKLSPTSQMGESSSVSSQKKPGKRRSHKFPNSQKTWENALDGFINFSNMRNGDEKPDGG